MTAALALRGRSLCQETDLTAEEMTALVALAAELKAERAAGRERPRIGGQHIVLMFEKASTRTRAAFEAAAADQAVAVTTFGRSDSHLGREESLADTARVLGGMFDGIAYRGHGQDRVEALAAAAGVPVWNALTDEWHPTQMLADVLTMTEATGRPPHELSFCFLGDTRYNMARSLLVTGALLGMDVRLGGPRELWPPDNVRALADQVAQPSTRATCTEDVDAAVRGVDFVYTDVWVSMGEPADRWDERLERLVPYRVDQALLDRTGNPDVKLLHCLPALHDDQTELGAELHRRTGLMGIEVSDEVFSSPASLVFTQSANRMHAIKALLVATLAR